MFKDTVWIGDTFDNPVSILFISTVAHSCHHLLSLGKQTGVQFPDGVYTINPDGKGPVKTYCDMTHDGGGWTLLVTSHTNTWTADNIKQRNPNRPTLNGDFSILYKADDIKNSLNVAGEWFEYRIEGHERGKLYTRRNLWDRACCTERF